MLNGFLTVQKSTRFHLILTSNYIFKERNFPYNHRADFNLTAYLSDFIFYDTLNKINSITTWKYDKIKQIIIFLYMILSLLPTSVNVGLTDYSSIENRN